jgi:excinuclease ABC subunit B
MYADRMTDSMKFALDETNRRRAKQVKHNQEHGIRRLAFTKPSAILPIRFRRRPRKGARPGGIEGRISGWQESPRRRYGRIAKLMQEMEKQMKEAAKNLEFEKAAALRDEIYELKGHPGG